MRLLRRANYRAKCATPEGGLPELSGVGAAKTNSTTRHMENKMTGSDFNHLPDGPIVTTLVAYAFVVIGLWELAKAILPHIHLFWK